MSLSDVKTAMRELLLDITREQSFWDALDEMIEEEFAKAHCLIAFSDTLVTVYIGENGPTKNFPISDVGLYAEYDDRVPLSPYQAEEAERELRAIDNFSASVQELRAQVAANIDRYRAAKVSKPGNVV